MADVSWLVRSGRGVLILGGVAVGPLLLRALARARARAAAAAVAAAQQLRVRGRPVRLLSRGADPLLVERELRAALERLRAASPVGLDAEWRPGSRGTVAVLQIASLAEVLVLHLAALALSDSSRALLRDFLADPTIVKLGVGVANDESRLLAIGLPTSSHLDICDDFAPELDLAPDDVPRVGDRSLRALAKRWLSIELDKSCQCSDWGALKPGGLSEAQVAYAALDALVSLEVAHAMHAQACQRAEAAQAAQPNERSVHARAEGGGSPASALPFGEACAFAAAAARRAGCAAGKPQPSANGSVECAGAEKQRKQEPSDARAGSGRAPLSRPPKPAYKIAARATELYENCLILGPDGERLAVCSNKKIKWYLDRGLADLVPHPDSVDGEGGKLADLVPRPDSVEPAQPGARAAGNGQAPSAGCGSGAQEGGGCQDRRVAIRLRFAPGGRGHADDAFYLEPKQNRCCACGADEPYVRHGIVPHAYRQHFPTAMKSHLSHDVVLLCLRCHARASERMCARCVHVAAELGVPLEHEAAEQKLQRDPQRLAVRRSARALRADDGAASEGGAAGCEDGGGGGGRAGGGKKRRAQKEGGSLPAERREEHARVVASFYGLTSPSLLTAAHIADACALEATTVNPRWVPHGKLVVDRLGGEDGIADFVRGWRVHFLEAMRPTHLPAKWSVDARVANSTAAVFGGKSRALAAAAAMRAAAKADSETSADALSLADE